MYSFTSCPDYTPENCRRAVAQAAGDLSWVRPGMRIGIKANLVHGAPPDTAATTHPELLRALIGLLRERGAQVVLGDSPGGLYNAVHLDRVYRLCGLEGLGAELNHDFSVAEAENPAGKVLRSFSYTGWLDTCDAVINFCKLKTHGMMAMTCAVKNLFGTIPGTMKPEYHMRFPAIGDFADMLIDLQQYWKPRLHLVDAVVTMEGNGPTAGRPRAMGLVLGGDDPYQLDQVCARLIGLEPEQVPIQKAAMERGLVGEEPLPEGLLPYVQGDFDLPPTKSITFRSALPGRAGELAGRTLQLLLAPRPTLHEALCVGCGKCARTCPAKAITMAGSRPVIHRRQCILCFCCQEFCPEGALKAQRTRIAKLLGR